jgi:hypothetical protein
LPHAEVIVVFGVGTTILATVCSYRWSHGWRSHSAESQRL